MALLVVNMNTRPLFDCDFLTTLIIQKLQIHIGKSLNFRIAVIPFRNSGWHRRVWLLPRKVCYAFGGLFARWKNVVTGDGREFGPSIWIGLGTCGFGSIFGMCSE